MKISLNWLRSYMDFNLSADEIARKLTMVGLEVEEVHSKPSAFDQVVIGKVLSVNKHPNADKLSVCDVDTGSETLSVVCGAPNVKAGLFVPVAKIGGRAADMDIREVTIRGVQSYGMICSERELGLSDNHQGILIIDNPSGKPGQLYLPEFQVPDTVLEINITPNRPDCLSHLGIARELGAILKIPVNRPDDTLQESGGSADQKIAIEIISQDGCPRYSARYIHDVKIGPSPAWLRSRLASVGIRSINNIVDVTNYVLMETGHPLHAFDYDQIAGHGIIVRKARKGERFTTLDENEHVLNEHDLLICDGERPVALAGIMGGLNSEVTGETHHILLESAYFDPMTVRRTAKRLGLNTEASQRFERGADPNGTIYAINRASKMMSEICGGTVYSGIADRVPSDIKPVSITLRSDRISVVLGTNVPHEEVLTILKHLDLNIARPDDPIEVIVPTFRPDLINEIDLIEEVVRHYGFDHIPVNPVMKTAYQKTEDIGSKNTETIRDIMTGMGFIEVLNNTLVSQKHTSLVPDVKPVSLQNPLSPETQFLRTNILANLLDNVQYNINRGERNLMLFEIGNVFHQSGDRLPHESPVLGLCITGHTHPTPFWQASGTTESNLFHFKGFLQNLGKRLHLPDLSFASGISGLLGDGIAVFSGQKRIGLMGEVPQSVLEHWDIQFPVFACEFELLSLLDKIPSTIRFAQIPRFPSVKRDLAVLVEKGIHAKDMIDLIQKTGGNLISKIDIFDVYEGKSLKENQKSVAFALTFMSMDRTLREEDIHPVFNKIVQALSDKFHAALRS
ncbi:phenylalanine--tRNA ligase subunit beta [bacterium]|nr:phenylalanine--tRNA ligase subunit beta [bacterium]